MFESHIKKIYGILLFVVNSRRRCRLNRYVCAYIFGLKLRMCAGISGFGSLEIHFIHHFFHFCISIFFLFPRDPCITAFFGYLCLVEGPLAAICECLFHLFILCDQNPGSGGHFIHARKVGKRCQLNSLIHN